MRRFLVFSLTLASLGCTAPAPDVPAPTAAAPVASYSPFVLEVRGEAPFRLISFKDVGMSLPEDDRALVYESLAESLAYSLEGDGALVSRVVHDPGVTQPEAHLACEGGHIYVDVWSAAEGYGYSLWSGCGEDDRFAHREIASAAPATEDAVAALLPLAEDMAAQLRSAVATGCFTRRC